MTKPVNAVSEAQFDDMEEFQQIANVTSSSDTRIDHLERELAQLKTQTHTFQTDLRGSVDTLKVDVDKRLKLVESGIDSTQSMSWLSNT